MGVKVDPLSSSIPAAKFEEIFQTLTNHGVSFETKQRVLNRAVSQCPSITIDILGQKIPSLLDSGSMVMLICEKYFKKNILPLLKKSAGDLTEAHSLFQLSAANNEVMPVSKYFEADVTFFGFTILHVGFLVVKDPNTLLEPQHSTQLPGVIGCNLICLECEEFGRVYGFKALEEFHCPSNIHPVVFSQMCSFYHQGKLSESTQTQAASQTTSGIININNVRINAEVEETNPGQESVLGQVWVGNTCQAICIPANSVKVIQGRTNKITQWLSCMVEARVCHNLPQGIVLNRTMVTPCKNKQVPVALMNTNTYNVWIHQPLLVANIVEAEDCPWDYQTSMSHDGNKINIKFCPVPSTEVQAEILAVSVTTAEPGNKPKMTPEGGERPKFRSQSGFNWKFDFKKELGQLPFPVNMGEVEMTESQQKGSFSSSTTTKVYFHCVMKTLVFVTT